MKQITRLFLIAVTAFLLAGNAARGDSITGQRELMPPPADPQRQQPPMPRLDDDEKAYLVALARRALEHSARTGQEYEPRDAPRSLRDTDYPIYMSVRSAGHLIGSIGSEGRSIVESITRAAHHLGTKERYIPLPPGTPPDEEPPAEPAGAEKVAAVRGTRIDIEILGPGQEIRWGVLNDIAMAIQPGIHGLAARYRVSERSERPVRYKTVAFKASVAVTHNYGSELMVHELIKKAGWLVPQVMANKNIVRFYRFRSMHLLEWPTARGGYHELIRGARLVSQESMTAAHLDKLIRMTGDYIAYRQLKDGTFSYMYVPSERRYNNENNTTRQAAAAWAMSRLANVLGQARDEVAALRAIEAVQLQYVGGGQTAACAVYPRLNRPRKTSTGAMQGPRLGLGQTAFILMAIVDLPPGKARDALAPVRDKLAAGILHQQRANGSIKCYFSNDDDGANEYYFPGEALLALMKTYQATRDPKYLAAVEKAFPYFQNLFATTESASLKQSFAPWQSQAYELAWAETRKAEYLEFVNQMGDYQASFQAGPEQAAFPDLVGGFINDQGFAGIGSSTYLEGMVANYRAALASNDRERTERYRTVLQRGARFLDQLTFKDVEAFYCISKPDVVGGLKFSVFNHSIRIDNNQHGLLALIGIREALFGKIEKK